MSDCVEYALGKGVGARWISQNCIELTDSIGDLHGCVQITFENEADGVFMMDVLDRQIDLLRRRMAREVKSRVK